MSQQFFKFPIKCLKLYFDDEKQNIERNDFLIEYEHVLHSIFLEIYFPDQSFAYYMRMQSQKIAQYLAKNLLKVEALNNVELALKKSLQRKNQYSLKNWFENHQLSVVSFFKSNPEFISELTKISVKQLSDPIIEMIILSSSEVKKDVAIEDILEALLLTAFFPLRQTIGSCFATSFVILLQNENKKIFLEELITLVTRNFLKRVIEGKDFLVPLNANIEKEAAGFDEKKLTLLQKQLADQKIKSIDLRFLSPPPLLKAFEYTIASMTEFNLDSHTSSLFLSLGIDVKVNKGLGEKVYYLVERELQAVNEEAKEAHIEAQKALDVLNMTNSQLQNAYSEQKVQSLKAQGYSYQSHLQAAIDRRDILIKEAEEVSKFFADWTEKIANHLKIYFQEVFDPLLKKEGEISYEDSPAGFRLVCKHGRENIRAWTLIENIKDYEKAFKEFFLNYEHILLQEFKTKRLKNLISSITSLSIQYVLDEYFEEEALKRLKLQQTPYTYIKPWCYISGGTLKSVLGCFTAKTTHLKEIVMQPKDATELFVKLADFFKDSPARFQERFQQDTKRGLLVQSETHAFILKPGLKRFQLFWADQNFSYTTIRDNFLQPLQNFYQNIKIKNGQVEEILLSLQQEFGKKITLKNLKPQTIPQLIQLIQDASPIPVNLLMGFFHRYVKEFYPDFPALSSIPFADTNWPYFYFSFIVNPVSCQLEIWRESFDESVYLPMIEWGEQFHGKNGWVLFLETLDQLNFSSIELLKLYYKV